jgi:sensitive to high expression protein 9
MLRTTAASPRFLQRYKQPAAQGLRTTSRRQFSASNHERPTNDRVRDRLRGWSQQAAGSVKKHAGSLVVAAQSTMSQLGSQLNKMTGYEEIETLKKRVVEQGILF